MKHIISFVICFAGTFYTIITFGYPENTIYTPPYTASSPMQALRAPYQLNSICLLNVYQCQFEDPTHFYEARCSVCNRIGVSLRSLRCVCVSISYANPIKYRKSG